MEVPNEDFDSLDLLGLDGYVEWGVTEPGGGVVDARCG